MDLLEEAEAIQKKLLSCFSGRALLWFLSILYQGVLFVRDALYQNRILREEKVSQLVISVGNLVAGGVGKTPIVREIAKSLSLKCRVAIVSRGYRSLLEKKGEISLVDSEMDPAFCGDEPLLLARTIPRVPVFVGVNRKKVVKEKIDKAAQIILLDDGFQYRKIKKDRQVVVVDGEKELSKEAYLPLGRLRDLRSRIQEATLVVVIGELKQGVKEELQKTTKAPIVRFIRRVDDHFLGKRVALFCAIGMPQRFRKSVEESGATILASLEKGDHDTFSFNELSELLKSSKADALVCTEKDAVKLKIGHPLPIQVFKENLVLQEGVGHWEQFLSDISKEVS